MKQTRLLMGMPVTVIVNDNQATAKDINDIYDYFNYVDRKFSTYKEDSEISKINRDELKAEQYSDDMKEILKMADITRKETNGYFDIRHNGKLDPSGIVKGWAILEAAKLLELKGFKNFYVDAGGDIQVKGKNSKGKKWTIGIRNPFSREEVVKVLEIETEGVATSGTYIRGQHVYNPYEPFKTIDDIVSLTVIGPNIFDADRIATAAFAMKKEGIYFLENLKGYEGYLIDSKGIATMTSGFNNYVQNN
ncbi:MAG TPA: FAD:protein FMN transferase [Patescibacteria group bacterium]